MFMKTLFKNCHQIKDGNGRLYENTLTHFKCIEGKSELLVNDIKEAVHKLNGFF